MNVNHLPRAQWSSYTSYVIVTIGAIVGLGNIFHFPFLVAKWGGLFVLFYIGSEIFFAIPLLFAELLIGRRGKQNPVGAISILAMESNASLKWRYIGWLCFIILFLTLAYYTVSVAFPLGYLFDTIKLIIAHKSSADLGTVDYFHLATHSFAFEMAFMAFLIATLLVVIRGINRGLEGISLITVPTYFIILALLAIFTCSQGGFIESINYLFHIPNNEPLWPIAFAALTFAFFKLNVGMGSMMVYGSYLPYSVPLTQSTIIILLFDAVASLLSYFIIYPSMLQSHLFPFEDALSYHHIMLIFSSHPQGLFVAALFFLASIIAAWTASIAMAESAVLTLIERCQISRLRSSILVGFGAFLVGLIVILSITKWPEVILFSTWNIGDFIQNFASDLATPVSAFFIAIFAGWIVSQTITSSELTFYPGIYKIWLAILRFIAPLFIIIIFFGIGFN